MSSREPQHRQRRWPHSRHAGRGGTLLGIFVGLVLGLAIAAAVAYYLGKSGLVGPAQNLGATKEPVRVGKADGTLPGAAPDKPRFDFYKILPGTEEPKVAAVRKGSDKASAETIAKPTEVAPAKPVDRYWLQAGAFASESDAENLKARLALSGWEAAIQASTLPDKSVRYRVRLGPFDNTDELNKIKGELGQRGFDVAVIKNQ